MTLRGARHSIPRAVGRAAVPALSALRARLAPRPRPARWRIGVPIPPDVADREQIRALLADTDIFGPAEAEAHGYLTDALDRFRITMAFLPEGLGGQHRVLELGANPYFMTRLLRRRGLDMTCANFFGPGFAARETQVSHTRDGAAETFEYDHFNIESDRFPYPDGSFDLVLCCEILEHLPSDPIHMLAEIHRVLRDGGRLLLTTPNAARLDNLLRLGRGENVYEQLSGYGAYGRHNRVYTLTELRRLLTECGYEVERAQAIDIHAHGGEWRRFPLGASPRDRGCNLFGLARAVGEPRWPYPDWLYSSVHALRRVVRDDVRMGYNDQLQTEGFHPLENVGGIPGRWLGAAPEARATLVAPGGPAVLRIEGRACPATLVRPVTLTVEVDGWRTTWQVPRDGRPFELTSDVDLAAGRHEVRLVCDRWSPSAEGLGADARTLGAYLTRIAVEAGPRAHPAASR